MQKSLILDAFGELESVLAGGVRAEIVSEIMRTGGEEDWFRRLRSSMGAHGFRAGSATKTFDKWVKRLDAQTRQDGFRVLHAWDHNEHRFTEDIVPVLMLDFHQRARSEHSNAAVSLAILLDYYFLHLLALCAMRVWDDADADTNLDRLTELVGALQGAEGSGHHFVDDAETLLIYGLSQFHPEEQAYDRLIQRVTQLSERHQMTFARVSTAVLSAHLRWGLWLMYDRDVVRMRNDNVGDYPWLLNSVLTLLRGYARSVDGNVMSEERARVVGGLVQGLAADPWAFRGKAPGALAGYGSDYAEVLDLLQRYGTRFLEDAQEHRPSKEAYSPLALHFNFPHNTLVAIVTLALLEGRAQPLSLNELFVQNPTDEADEKGKERLARTLMAFSRSSPDRLGYQGAMLVAYDPLTALRSFSMTMDVLKKSLEGLP
ncbi:MAG: hypothetical protein O2958_04105 [Gemmatimonadetes bacterium]|nr:hypothetical protein [Gemmatimonadota bacterium]MDA1102488.1 hypothetical protein [Gemmatimonadota bacterium]